MITKILFESWWLLAVVWIVIQFVAIAYWSWRRTDVAKYVVWVGFALLPILLLTSKLVVTDREQIVELCHQLGIAVETADVDYIAGYLADDFSAQGYDKATFVERLRSRLGDTRLADVSLGSFMVELTDSDEPLAEFSALLQIDSPDFAYEWVTIRCRVTWRRTSIDGRRASNTWLITKVEQIPNNVAPLRQLADWLR